MTLKTRILSSLFVSSILVTQTSTLKADWDYWAVKVNADATGKGYDIFTINNDTGEATLRDTKCIIDPGYGHCESGLSSDSAYVDPTSGDLWLQVQNNIYSYNLETDTWTDRGSKWKNNYTVVEARSAVSNTSDGSINIGSGSDILLKKKTNGEYHIGKNSLVTKEENGMQNLWGQDANGKKIPVNIKGSKLLINGRDVEQSINNVGALSAALTGLPTVPKDTTLACGLGTGTHGGDFAFSGGCASKVNEKLSINYAASMTMPGQDYAGDFEDQFSARAGFVWKLGKATKPTQISMNEKKVFETKIKTLEDKNNQLLARLERLEKFALKDLNANDLAVFKLQ